MKKVEMNKKMKEEIRKAQKSAKEEAGEFKKFISKGNVVDMAVGVIIGGSFGKIVTSLVNDIITPIIGIIIGGIDFSNLSIQINEAKIMYGNFIQTIIDLYNSGKSVTDLSVEYGVKKVTIYSWINQNKPALKVDDEEISKSDIIALKKRIMELEEENEILKKATAIFAKRK